MARDLAAFVLVSLLLTSYIDAECDQGSVRRCEATWQTRVIAYGGSFAVNKLLATVGFGPKGIVKRSIASRAQSLMKNVSRGSAFSKLQSLGTKGVDFECAYSIAAWAARIGVPEPLEAALGLSCACEAPFY